VPISAEAGGQCYDANADNAYAGLYPIARFLYIYVNKNPNQALDPLRGEFIRFVYSKEGQNAVVKDGYFPVDHQLADTDLKAFGLK
jgi:phosphate transport system substrate-binding protein